MKILFASAALLIIAASAYFGRVVPFAEQWPLFEAIRTTAAIIFAVVGAWFAIIYPERLKLSFKGPNGIKKSLLESDSGINRLFTPIVHSTCILSLILLIGLAAPILKRMDIAEEYRAHCRGISFSLLTTLTLWQLFTVLYSLVGPDIIKTYSDHEEGKKAFVDGLTKLQKR